MCPVWDVMSENDPMAVMCEERAGARAAGPIELRAGRPAQLVLRRRGRSRAARARARVQERCRNTQCGTPYRTGAVYLYGYAGNAGARSVQVVAMYAPGAAGRRAKDKNATIY